jgi:hypothetical protein
VNPSVARAKAYVITVVIGSAVRLLSVLFALVEAATTDDHGPKQQERFDRGSGSTTRGLQPCSGAFAPGARIGARIIVICSKANTVIRGRIGRRNPESANADV